MREETMSPEIRELESQTALVVAALGAIFAKTLAEDDVPPMVLKSLRTKAAEMDQYLQAQNAESAVRMLAPFLRALNDPDLFPRST
jgi:hypothetical protein